MESFPHIPLGEVAEIFVGFARHGKGFSRDEKRTRVKLIGMRALQSTGLDCTAIETAHFAPGFDYGSYQIAAHDILIACRAPEIRVALAPLELAGVVIDANVMALRCGPRLAPIVLAAYLQHPAGRAALERASQSTTTQKNLTVKALKKIPIPLVPLDVQAPLVRLLEVAEQQYRGAVRAAERRIQLAQQITVNTLYGGGEHGLGTISADHA